MQQKDRPWPTHVRQNCWAPPKIALRSHWIWASEWNHRGSWTHTHSQKLDHRQKYSCNYWIWRVINSMMWTKECDKMCDSDTIHHCVESYLHTQVLNKSFLKVWTLVSQPVKLDLLSSCSWKVTVWVRAEQCAPLKMHSASLSGRYVTQMRVNSSIKLLSVKNYLMHNNIVNMIIVAQAVCQFLSHRFHFWKGTVGVKFVVYININ